MREISYETAYKGSSANKIFTDRKLFTDLWTNYYLDCKPQWAWVAKYKNKVVGYIIGSANNYQYKKKMISRIIPKAVIGAIFRGTLWQKNNWWLLNYWHNLSGEVSPETPPRKCPSRKIYLV